MIRTRSCFPLAALALLASAACSEPTAPSSVAHADEADNVVGDITPSSVTVGGRLVIDETGNWVGEMAAPWEIGPGLALNGDVLSADTEVLQRKVGQCPAGSAMRAVDGQGEPTCEAILDPRFGGSFVPEGSGNNDTSGDCLIGEVRLFAGNFAPHGMVAADGRVLRIAEHTALFSLLGIQYGGDGQTTFALPNLTDVAPHGVGYVICVSGIFPARD